MRGSGGGWFGKAVPLRRFNSLPADDAAALVRLCLPLPRWSEAVVDARPYRSLNDLYEVARDAAFPFTPAELEAAVAAVGAPAVVPPPRPGESPDEIRIREQLDSGIQHYRRRFGRPFLIRTEGRTSRQLLVQLLDRLGHDLDTEDRVLAQQLKETALLALARCVRD